MFSSLPGEAAAGGIVAGRGLSALQNHTQFRKPLPTPSQRRFLLLPAANCHCQLNYCLSSTSSAASATFGSVVCLLGKLNSSDVNTGIINRATVNTEVKISALSPSINFENPASG